MEKISSAIRYTVNIAVKRVIGTGKLYKQLSVLYYNTKSLMEFKSYREDANLFNYRAIIKGRKNFFIHEMYRANSDYSIAPNLRQYSGYKNKINACIEHGVYFGEENFYKSEVEKSGLNGIITFGNRRLQILEKVADVPIITIGPYIHYANCLMSDLEISKWKKERGKTLLVFPAHSIDRITAEYEISDFIQWINNFSRLHKFKCVIVCLYWRDIILGRDIPYINNGFKVVCAGYRNSPLFLSRLKTFIALADYTLSNDIGTHTGYCVYMGKGHLVYNQPIASRPINSFDLEYEPIYYNSTLLDKARIKRAFSVFKQVPDKDQVNAVKDYWGFDCVLNREQLYDILYSLEKKHLL